MYDACRRHRIPIGVAPNIEVSLVVNPDDAALLADADAGILCVRGVAAGAPGGRASALLVAHAGPAAETRRAAAREWRGGSSLESGGPENLRKSTRPPPGGWHSHCDTCECFGTRRQTMIDREKVLAVLRNRFPDALPAAVAGAANAIVGLPDEWEDVSDKDDQLGYHYSPQCSDICYLAQQVERGDEFRLFRRRAVGPVRRP